MSKHKSKHKPKAISLMTNSNLIDKKCILYFFQGNLNNLKAKQVNIKKNKYHTININDLEPFLLDIKKNLLNTLIFITLITFKKILIVITHYV